MQKNNTFLCFGVKRGQNSLIVKPLRCSSIHPMRCEQFPSRIAQRLAGTNGGCTEMIVTSKKGGFELLKPLFLRSRSHKKVPSAPSYHSLHLMMIPFRPTFLHHSPISKILLPLSSLSIIGDPGFSHICEMVGNKNCHSTPNHHSPNQTTFLLHIDRLEKAFSLPIGT